MPHNPSDEPKQSPQNQPSSASDSKVGINRHRQSSRTNLAAVVGRVALDHHYPIARAYSDVSTQL